MIQTFIINMKKHTERKKYVEDALKKTIIQNYSFIEAVDGEIDLDKYDFKIMPNWYDNTKDRTITVGEIGCALSHYKIWEKMVNEKIEKALILEDDVVFLENFNEEYTNIQNISFHYDLFLLGRRREYYHMNFDTEDEIEINDLLVIPKYSYNLHSYILTYEGALKLINTQYLNHLIPVDEFLPIMYDINYPHVEYKKPFEKFKRIRTIAFKKCITNQMTKTIFPSSIDVSSIYCDKTPLFYYKSVPDYVIKKSIR